MDLGVLQKEAHAIAKEKGWWPPRCEDCGGQARWSQGDYYGTHPDEWFCDVCGIDVPSGHGYIESRTFGDLIALGHSALSEALEAYRAWGCKAGYTVSPGNRFVGADDPKVEAAVSARPVRPKPAGVPAALADVVIRVADMAEWYGWELDPLGSLDFIFLTPSSFGSAINVCHGLLSRTDTTDVLQWLRQVLVYIQRMAAHYGIDLDAAIEAKLDYNRTRPCRHGGKML